MHKYKVWDVLYVAIKVSFFDQILSKAITTAGIAQHEDDKKKLYYLM